MNRKSLRFKKVRATMTTCRRPKRQKQPKLERVSRRSATGGAPCRPNKHDNQLRAAIEDSRFHFAINQGNQRTPRAMRHREKTCLLVPCRTIVFLPHTRWCIAPFLAVVLLLPGRTAVFLPHPLRSDMRCRHNRRGEKPMVRQGLSKRLVENAKQLPSNQRLSIMGLPNCATLPPLPALHKGSRR